MARALEVPPLSAAGVLIYTRSLAKVLSRPVPMGPGTGRPPSGHNAGCAFTGVIAAPSLSQAWGMRGPGMGQAPSLASPSFIQQSHR